MLFSRNILPSCSYCQFGSFIGGGEVACVKRGIVSAGSYCRQYLYDPLKRIPDVQPDIKLRPLADSFPEDLDSGAEAEHLSQLGEELSAALDIDYLQ